MASNNSVQQFTQMQPQQSQQQQPQQSSPHPCKECGVFFNSGESLEVHLRYHKENLLNKWASQAAAAAAASSNPSSNSEETNNNTTKNNATIKREFLQNSVTSVAADSSDSLNIKKSPEYNGGNRATPDTYILGHPPTPQSYHSASSPYQNVDNATFSPGFQSYQPIKTERASPGVANNFQQNYSNFSDSQFFNLEQPYQNYQQDHSQSAIHKMSQNSNTFRYHPYHSYERGNNSVTSSSSPASYPPQPTPSPSPKQCDKCGYVCESASQLIEHLNVAHPPTPAPHLASYQQQQQQQQHQQNQFMFAPHEIKTEDDTQSEILDLDSHKVHQVYPEDDKRQNGELNGHNPHSVSAMLSWPQQQHKMIEQQQRMYEQQKMFHNVSDTKLFPPEQKMYPQQTAQQPPPQDYLNGGEQSLQHQNPQQYRTPFEHIPPQPVAPVISSTQVPNAPSPANVQVSTKSTNWKSNEARRPKTYNCTACNKWFTSSGHLKRHYNTTLHKNAVKSSGQPDPATLPISAHHHPARESAASKDDRNSSSPHDDSRGEDSLLGQSFVQQSPNPYDRPPPNMHHPATLHSPMHSPMGPSPNSNLSAGSPPNGEAGPSATTNNNLDSRGLLTTINSSTHHHQIPHQHPPHHHHGFQMAPMMSMDNGQFPMYPNGSAPHVTHQVTAIITTNSLNTTGEYNNHYNNREGESQPLPSFAQFTAHRYGGMTTISPADVGGTGPVTAPYTYYATENYELPEARTLIFRQDDDDEYKLTVMTTAQPALEADPYTRNSTTTIEMATSTNKHNNNMETQPGSPEKAHLQRDLLLEENGSPQITSTTAVVNNNNNTTNSKQAIIHKCHDCDKIFNKSCYLTQHNKTFHDGDRPFKCSRCGKRFPTERIIEEHERKHGGEKPHKCEMCPKQFNHKTDLRRHMCLHTGNKPYSCITCGKGFIRKDHMLKHCETHLRRPKLSTTARSG